MIKKISLYLNKIFFPHDHKEKHVKSLDGLRGLAVLIVLLSHSSNANWMFHSYLNFKGIGKSGVYLFFLLSAYLLDRQIAIALRENKATKRYWYNYILRRFLRIYPLFLVSLIVHVVLNYFGFSNPISLKNNFIDHFLLLDGESIFWSIPVEFKYYIISPFIMIICHRFLKWNLKSIAFLFILFMIVSQFFEYTYGLTIYSTLRYLPIFIVGTYLAISEVLDKNYFSSSKSKKRLDYLGVVMLSVFFLTIPKYFSFLFDVKVDFHHPGFYIPYSVLWAFVLLAAKFGRNILTKIFEFKPLRFLGSISYSAYLFHMPVLLILRKIDLIPNELKIYSFFIGTLFIASLSFIFIERPLSKIRIKPKKNWNRT